MKQSINYPDSNVDREIMVCPVFKEEKEKERNLGGWERLESKG